MSSSLEIQLIAIIVSIACSLPGSFLLLQKMSMMTDAITHTILLGIVIAFFVVQDLNSPFLIIGATVMGVITVRLTQLLSVAKFVSEDSAIGIVFPFLFSIAILLISKYASSSHIDTDSVLLGELAFAPFNRLVICGVDIGAKSIYSCGIILLINISFITLFFKELKITTFDPLFALSIGISPAIIHYFLMFIVSLTTVGAFEAVGSVLVVGFMVGPSSIAYLLTDDLKTMLLLSSFFSAISAVLGYQIAFIFDVSIAGSIAVTIGILFAIVFALAPKRGLISIYMKKSKQKKNFKELLILRHINKS